MKSRAAAAIALLPLLSGAALAQRSSGRGVGSNLPGLTEPATERKPEPIARAIAYQRSRIATETYTGWNFGSGAALPNATLKSFSGFGQGAHLEYMTTPSLMPTLDLTSSYPGGLSSMFTVELGGRYRPISDWDHAVRPYLDVRAGYVESHGQYAPAGNPNVATGSLSSRGFGLIAGVGTEYWFATRFAVTAGASAVRSGLNSYNQTAILAPAAGTYWMNTYRLTVGLKYNQATAPMALAQPR
jgi:hypothetical protein